MRTAFPSASIEGVGRKLARHRSQCSGSVCIVVKDHACRSVKTDDFMDVLRSLVSMMGTTSRWVSEGQCVVANRAQTPQVPSAQSLLLSCAALIMWRPVAGMMTVNGGRCWLACAGQRYLCCRSVTDLSVARVAIRTGSRILSGWGKDRENLGALPARPEKCPEW